MRFLAAAALLILMVPFSVSADEGKTEPFTGIIKYVKYHVDYDVNPDGTHTENHEEIIEVLTDEGVEAANQETIRYSESLEEVEILSAYTLKKDGRRIDVPAENIQVRDVVAAGGPMYSDIKARVIIFPDVGVGDRVGYSYRVVQKTPLFPGHFSMTIAFTRFVVYDDVRIGVSVPTDSLKVRTLASGVRGGRVQDGNGRTRWVWTYENSEITTPEYGAVDALDYGPRIIVSSFKDYAAIAAAYEKRARPKAAVTDKIRRLAEELTRGKKGRKEQARALYTWVAQNIRYAGNCIGVGSVVPHDAEMVLANKLGDCKDHTALLQALLEARGIESTPALVNYGSSYKLPEVPTVTVFNHVINYIPSLDLYLDSTSEFTPFGLLPAGEADKPVIHTTNFKGIRHTPPTDYKVNRSHTKTVIRVHEDGSADGETSNEERGVFSIGIRAAMASLQPNMEDRLMRGILARSSYSGTGTIIKSNPRDTGDSYTYGAKYHLDNYMNLPGPGAIHIAPVLPNAAPVSSALSGFNMPEATLDYQCFNGSSTEEYRIELPPGVKVLALPKDTHLAVSNLSYDATYRQDGSAIIVVRRFEDRTPRNVCTPEDDREARSIMGGVLKDLRSQIIYE